MIWICLLIESNKRLTACLHLLASEKNFVVATTVGKCFVRGVEELTLFCLVSVVAGVVTDQHLCR